MLRFLRHLLCDFVQFFVLLNPPALLLDACLVERFDEHSAWRICAKLETLSASWVPTVAAAANSAIPTLRHHSVAAVAAQFQVNLSVASQTSVAWCTPWRNFSQNSQGKIDIGQEAVSVCGRARKLLDWAEEIFRWISCRSSCTKVSSLHLQLPRSGRELEKVVHGIH